MTLYLKNYSAAAPEYPVKTKQTFSCKSTLGVVDNEAK